MDSVLAPPATATAGLGEAATMAAAARVVRIDDPSPIVDAALKHLDVQAGALVSELSFDVQQNRADGGRWLALCMALYSHTVIDLAKDCFWQAALRLDQDGRPHYFLARIAERFGDPRAALDFYQVALQRAPDQGWLHWRAGFAALALGDLERAQLHFDTVLLAAPGLKPALVGAARVALQQDHPQAAVDLLQDVSGDSEDEAASLGQLLATAYQRLGRADEAAALRASLGPTALAEEPWTDPWQLEAGSFASGFGVAMQQVAAMLEADQVDEAITTLEVLLAAHPDRDEVHLRLGTAYGMKGDFERARQAFTAVVDKGSARGYALEGLARSYLLQAETALAPERVVLLAEALRHADAAATDPQSPPGAQGLRGDVLQLQGDRPGALAAYSAAAAAEPRQAKWRLAMARIHLLMGDWEAAAGDARLASELDPGPAGAWAVQAFAAARLGDAPSAEAALDQARRRSADDPQVRAAATEVQAMKATP
ncbi:MAG: tetratricopeptide repeat protein [Ardenticatenia bacterium]|nr:tetratricopeptide repeat protein [Ardenticatenia bacterium]